MPRDLRLSLPLLLATLGLATGCKKPPPSPGPLVDAGNMTTTTTATPIADAGQLVTSRRDAGGRRPPGIEFWIARLAVSSRVDNETETPWQIADSDPETAWSSRTGDLEGAWVELFVKGSGPIKSLAMTVGMTKSTMPGDPDLFLENPRISEVALRWTPVVGVATDAGKRERLGEPIPLVERHAFDIGSRDVQTIPVPQLIEPPGILRMTVRKVKMGAKPSWREVSISELALVDAWGLKVSAREVGVGPIDPAATHGAPRGILGIVPEEQPAFGCRAFVPNPLRVYCVVGHVMRGGHRDLDAALVAIDPGHTNRYAELVDIQPPPSTGEFVVPYGAFLKAERELKATGRPLPKDGKPVPWNGSVELAGTVFQQRETDRLADEPPMLNGVLEVKWPGDATFQPVLPKAGISATSPMTATLRPLGPTTWLVERTFAHGSEGLFGEGAAAALCDLATRTCSATPR